MKCRPSLPPGLVSSDVETATASRERRRVSLAAKAAVEEVSKVLENRFISIEKSLELLVAAVPEAFAARLARLETLVVCSPAADDVLEEMLSKRTHDRYQPAEEPSCHIGEEWQDGESLLTQPEHEQSPGSLTCLDEYYNVIVKDIGVQVDAAPGSEAATQVSFPVDEPKHEYTSSRQGYQLLDLRTDILNLEAKFSACEAKVLSLIAKQDGTDADVTKLSTSVISAEFENTMDNVTTDAISPPHTDSCLCDIPDRAGDAAISGGEARLVLPLHR